jgi:hypothetical protein
MVGILHLALLDGGQTKLQQNTDISTWAQTTLTFGEGGLSRMPSQSGLVPRWLTFQLALIPRLALLESRHLNHVVVVP